MAYSAVAAPRSEISVVCEVNVLVMHSGCRIPESREGQTASLLNSRGDGSLWVTIFAT